MQIGCAFGALDRRAGNVGNRLQVFIGVGLVDCQIVNPCGLEGNPGVLLDVELLRELLLSGEYELLDAFHGQPAAGGLRVGEHRSRVSASSLSM